MTRQQIERREKIDRIADHLANGLTLTQCAQRMGIARTYASKLLMQIRADLGWQAQ